MSEAKFKIGDRVRYFSDSFGVVSDILVRSKTSSVLYEVIADGRDEPSNCLLKEEDLELVGKEYSMQIQIDIAQNVVIASLFEVEAPNMRPIAKGHGHIIHEGANGIAQAASYACKKLYENLDGQITKGGSWR